MLNIALINVLKSIGGAHNSDKIVNSDIIRLYFIVLASFPGLKYLNSNF